MLITGLTEFSKYKSAECCIFLALSKKRKNSIEMRKFQEKWVNLFPSWKMITGFVTLHFSYHYIFEWFKFEIKKTQTNFSTINCMKVFLCVTSFVHDFAESSKLVPMAQLRMSHVSCDPLLQKGCPCLVYDVSKWIFDLILSFLNQVMKIVLNTYTSRSFHINAGIPQVSILGPILFLIFIHDFPNVISSQLSI